MREGEREQTRPQREAPNRRDPKQRDPETEAAWRSVPLGVGSTHTRIQNLDCTCIESTCAARQAEDSTGSVKELTREPHNRQREGAHQVWTAAVALAAALKPPETARQAGALLAA